MHLQRDFPALQEAFNITTTTAATIKGLLTNQMRFIYPTNQSDAD
jgi:hypothetical protein